MAKSREDFYREGFRSAIDPVSRAARTNPDGMPVFGEGKSWQSKAFAEGFRKGCADHHQSQCTHIHLSQGRCPVCDAGHASVSRVPVKVNDPETGADRVVLMRKSTADKLQRIAERAARRDKRVEKILVGYLDAVVFTGVEHDLPEGSDFSGDMEFSEGARSEAHKACEKFYLAAGADLGAFVDLYPSRVSAEHDPWEAIGHDLWLTRNGHGVGFWDRNMGRVGQRLAALCGYGKPFGPVDAYLGDDELVYFS